MKTRCNGEEVYTIIKFSEKVKNFMGDEWELNGFLNVLVRSLEHGIFKSLL